MFKASALIAGTTLISRILGFVRDILLAKLLGAGLTTDAFFIALRLPNMLRQLFAEGAFNVAFVPLLAKTLKEEGPQASAAFASTAFAVLLTITLFLTAIVLFFMPQVVHLMAPGLRQNPETFTLAVQLSYITFPYFVFIVATSFMGGVLNTLRRFLAFSLAPSVLNIAFIACMLTLPPYVPHPVFAAAWAVPLGGALQLALLGVGVYKSRFALKATWPRFTPAVKVLAKKALPSFVGVGAQQINAFLSTVLASFAGGGSISYLFYADRLNQLPLALIGIALATALLPTLTDAFLKDRALATSTFNKALSAGAALGFAAAGGLFTLSPEVINTLFVRGAFTQEAAHQTALALMAYSCGLPAYVLIKVTSTAFYAQHNTTQPVKAGLISIAAHIGFMVFLLPLYTHVGLAAAASLAGWLNALLQLFWLWQAKVFPPKAAVALCKGVLCAAGMVLVVVGYKTFLPFGQTAPLGTKIFWLTGAMGAGVISWLISLRLLGLHSFLTPLTAKLVKQKRQNQR